MAGTGGPPTTTNCSLIRAWKTVVVATPAAHHAADVVAAARAGKAVFDEKPIAQTLADADRALRATRRAGVRFQLGYRRRFALAHAGVPAFSISLGTDYEGKPPGYGEKVFEEYNDKHYHQPSDEYHDDWDFGGMEEVAQFAMQIATTVANQDTLPTWNAGDEFLTARQKSFSRK